MFKKIDTILLTAKTITTMLIIICAVASLAVGVSLAVLINWVYFIVIFVGWIFCFLFWDFANLLISFLCDIKLIRNKLYGINNEHLKEFLDSYEGLKTDSNEEIENKTVSVELAQLQILFDDGLINEEEYNRRKDELTK